METSKIESIDDIDFINGNYMIKVNPRKKTNAENCWQSYTIIKSNTVLLKLLKDLCFKKPNKQNTINKMIKSEELKNSKKEEDDKNASNSNSRRSIFDWSTLPVYELNSKKQSSNIASQKSGDFISVENSVSEDSKCGELVSFNNDPQDNLQFDFSDKKLLNDLKNHKFEPKNCPGISDSQKVSFNFSQSQCFNFNKLQGCFPEFVVLNSTDPNMGFLFSEFDTFVKEGVLLSGLSISNGVTGQNIRCCLLKDSLKMWMSVDQLYLSDSNAAYLHLKRKFVQKYSLENFCRVYKMNYTIF